MNYLEQISKLLNYEYISDVKYALITKAQAKTLLDFSSPELTLADYIDAADYILNKKTHFTNIDDAKKAIVNHLLQHKS